MPENPKPASAVEKSPRTAPAAGTSTASTASTPSTTRTVLLAPAPPDEAIPEIGPAPPMLEEPPLREAELSSAGIITGASRSRFTDEQRRILRQPIPAEDIDILPTGELYASQVRYRRILADAFGPGGWALLPLTAYFRAGNTLVREYALYVEGKYIAQAMGEAEYFPNSSRQTWATVAESVKSNALVRCAKDLLIASECWDAHFCERFKAEHCVRVFVDNVEQGITKTKALWRRKDAKPFAKERGVVEDVLTGTELVRAPRARPSVSESGPPPSAEPAPARTSPTSAISEAQQRKLFATCRAGRGVKALRDYLAIQFGLESTSDIRQDQFEEILRWAGSTS